jgi:hypothetical protein
MIARSDIAAGSSRSNEPARRLLKRLTIVVGESSEARRRGHRVTSLLESDDDQK